MVPGRLKLSIKSTAWDRYSFESKPGDFRRIVAAMVNRWRPGSGPAGGVVFCTPAILTLWDLVFRKSVNLKYLFGSEILTLWDLGIPKFYRIELRSQVTLGSCTAYY